MSDDARIFDRRAVRLHRDRAAPQLDEVRPLLDETASRLIERLDETTRRFTQALDVGGRASVTPLLRARGIDIVCCDLSAAMLSSETAACVVADEECLPFAPASFDLVVANLSLHWVNDLPGALIQLRRALKPEGLFLASVPALGTLASLRQALVEAEMAETGGASPRVSPFPELRDCAGLLQRAGFVLPVADVETIAIQYRDPLALVRDLRASGETNAVRLRERRVPPRGLFARAFGTLAADGAPMILRFAVMTGWAA